MKYATSKKAMMQHVLLLLLLAALLPLSYQCVKMPSEPVAPSWLTQLTVPLVDKTFYFADLINKDSKFDTTGGTILYKPTSDQFGYRDSIPSDVFIMPTVQGSTINQEINVVPFAVPSPKPVSLTVADLFPGLPTGVPLVGVTDQTVNISQPIDVSPDGSSIWLKFDAGTMTLTIQNTFPFAIQFTDANGIVTNKLDLVNDTLATTTIATFAFTGSIPANQQATSSPASSLIGKTMYKKVRMKGTIKTIGIAGTTLKSTDGIVSTLNIVGATIESALAKLTADFSGLTVTDTSGNVLLDDSIRVQIAQFQSGFMRVKIVNNVALGIKVIFRMSQLRDRLTGKQLVIDQSKLVGQEVSADKKDTSNIYLIPAQGAMDKVISLKDVLVVGKQNGATLTADNMMDYTLGIRTFVQATSYQQVSKKDFVQADVQPCDKNGNTVTPPPYILQSVTGQIPPKSISVNQEFNIGSSDLNSKFTLQGFKSAISLKMNMLISGAFPTNLTLWVVALNANNKLGDSVEVRTSYSDPAFPNLKNLIEPKKNTVINFTADNINTLMNSFLKVSVPSAERALPAKLVVRGEALMSPKDVYNNKTDKGLGSVAQGDTLRITLDYAIPVSIGIKEGSMKDTSSFAQNSIDTVKVELIKEGKIYLNVENTFPLDINLAMKLLRGKKNAKDSLIVDKTALPVLTLPQTPAIPADSVNYPPIRVVADTTTARTGQKSYTWINLTPEDAKKLGDASFTALDLKLNTAGNGSTAKEFRKTDKIRVKAFANIIFNVNFEKLK